MNDTLIQRMTGRCADGAERDSGVRWHAVPREGWKALCGANPGRTSAGWSEYLGEQVTCPRCLVKLAASGKKGE
jgi:hypothetical protein